MTPSRIVTLNAGSSSLKFAIYRKVDLGLELAGEVTGLGGRARLRATVGADLVADEPWPGDQALDSVLEGVIDWLDRTRWSDATVAVGHRIVHGGREFRDPVILAPGIMARLAKLEPLAPLHQPFNLLGVEIARRRFPGALQVGVFDTAFHAVQPDVARLYALPRELIDDGILAYGFHGLSYDYIAHRLRSDDVPEAGGRTIVLHLGSGVSLCAMRNGHSVATTMGFSALDGPPMSTRCGALDPGVVLHLIQARGMAVEAVSDLLYHRSGLLGLSGISGDMVTLLASDSPRAAQAIDVYVYRIAREIGSLTAALGGLDTMVFTAGVGEHAAPIRERIADLCGWLGVQLDAVANGAHALQISGPQSPVKLLVIPTDEQVVIARGVAGLLQSAAVAENG